eukprot:6179051-Pleurochrysis_carterae.AAC.4
MQARAHEPARAHPVRVCPAQALRCAKENVRKNALGHSASVCRLDWAVCASHTPEATDRIGLARHYKVFNVPLLSVCSRCNFVDHTKMLPFL